MFVIYLFPTIIFMIALHLEDWCHGIAYNMFKGHSFVVEV